MLLNFGADSVFFSADSTFYFGKLAIFRKYDTYTQIFNIK